MQKNIYNSFSYTPTQHLSQPTQHTRRKSQSIAYQQLGTGQQQQSQENILRNHIQQTINIVNEENNSVSYLKSIKWQLILLQPKRTIKGLKCKIRWKHQLSGVYLQFRMIFISSISNTKWLTQGQVLLQIDQLNFQCTLQQQRRIQRQLTGLLQKKPTQRKLSYEQQITQQSNWLKVFFINAQKFLVDRKFERRQKIKAYLISKQKINGNYIPYQSPVVFSWNPQGGYCLTENRLVKNQRPFICTQNSFKNHISFSNKCDSNSYMIQEKQEVNYEKERQDVFIWDLQEEIDFVLKTSIGDEISFINNKKDDEVASLTNQYRPKANDPNSQSFPLSQFPGQIKKLYSYLFGISSHMDTTQHLDKLKVYSINNQIKSMQNHLLFIIYRLNNEKSKSVWEIVLENQLPGYGALFSTGTINQFKYLIIYKALRSKLSYSPEHNFSLRLKAIIIENEHFHIELQEYFQKLYEISESTPPSKLMSLGSFQHFDQHRAEELFFYILKQVPAQTVYGKISQENFSMKLYHKFNLFEFQINWLLTEQQRINFNKKIIPILWIRQRNCMKLQYKQLAKIINTNSMIIKFYNTMNGIIKKLYEGRNSFIQSLIQKHQQQKAIMEQSMTYARRSFTIRCPVCSREVRTFQLVDITANTKCKLCESKKT